MNNPDNTDRACWAMRAVIEFRDVCQGSPLDDQEGIKEAVGDLIADLLHLARQNDIDPEAVLANGRMHFEAEEEEARYLEEESNARSKD